MRTFYPNNNPYADDLLRLRFAPEQRYTPLERVALGRVIAAKLYELALGYGRRFGGRQLWRNLGDGGCAVELHVVFDDAIKAGRLYRRLQRYRHRPERQLIVLIVGDHSVVEVFNGFQCELDRGHLAMALDAMRGTGDVYSPGREDAVRPRGDDDALANYRGIRNSAGSLRGDVDNSRVNSGANRSGGNGRGNGGNNGNDGPRGTPGSGGALELVNHPVLFAVERHVYDAILDEI